MAKESHWTESGIVRSLAKIWPHGAYVTLPQVRNGTGYTKRTRTADAVVASVWPSNGLWLAGVEVKLSRGDLRKELSDPTKSESIARYCHRWYVAGPSQLWDMTTMSMVPDTWGVIDCAANKVTILRPATVREPQAVDLLFVCSILRTAADSMVPQGDIMERERDVSEKALAAGKAQASGRVTELEETIKTFETASGVTLSAHWDAGDIGAAVRLVRSKGYLRIRGLVAQMRTAAETFQGHAAAALAEFDGE
jgi:hypothetical protein